MYNILLVIFILLYYIIYCHILKNQDTYVVRCAGAELPYRFEYQGASIGLVRTPLTEKCFLALTQAMKLGLGGSPTGPAGTGKTESVKELASVLGRLVLVFNCDEGKVSVPQSLQQKIVTLD